MIWDLLGKGVTVPRGLQPPGVMAGWDLCLASLTLACTGHLSLALVSAQTTSPCPSLT